MVYFHRFGLLHKRYFEEFPGKARAQHFVNAVEPLALASCKIYKVRYVVEVLVAGNDDGIESKLHANV